MSVRLPVYTYIDVDGYQMYPGTERCPGISHELIPGLHLVAGVNGLGKSTFLFLLYNGLVGAAAIRSDDFGVPMPEVVARRDVEKFRRRVADGARNAKCTIRFFIGDVRFEVTRSLYDLSLESWSKDSIDQDADENAFCDALVIEMNVGSFADVLIIMNLIVFMFESRGLLMWSPLAQRNALRALFMGPSEANLLAERAQAVARANSSYRNLLYIVNRDQKRLNKEKHALASADALTAENSSLRAAIEARTALHEELVLKRQDLDRMRLECRATHEAAKFNYDEILREIETLKLARVANAFPTAEKSSQYVIARLIGDRECLACGADGGPLIERWISTVSDGACLVCGAVHSEQEVVIPPVVVDAARLERAEQRLSKAREALAEAARQAREVNGNFEAAQAEIDANIQTRSVLEARVNQIRGVLPPSPPAVKELESQLASRSSVLEHLKNEQSIAEYEFSKVFDGFKTSIEQKADKIREIFGRRISEFLVEKAEISLQVIRGPIGESGQAYDWPVFQLSMTSGVFDAPSPRRSRAEVSMSQGEFIDLAFRLALIEAAAESSPATIVVDAPEASLDALFMRRAGAFLAKFTDDHSENRLVVTSNLTNADMIPAFFGAYEPQEGDPEPRAIPRPERKSRVIDLLELAAPSSAVSLVGDRYKNLLDRALFPPNGQSEPGL